MFLLPTASHSLTGTTSGLTRLPLQLPGRPSLGTHSSSSEAPTPAPIPKTPQNPTWRPPTSTPDPLLRVHPPCRPQTQSPEPHSEQLLARSTKSRRAPTADLSSWCCLPGPRDSLGWRPDGQGSFHPPPTSQQCWALHAQLGMRPRWHCTFLLAGTILRILPAEWPTVCIHQHFTFNTGI